jgi:hypothetical protein
MQVIQAPIIQYLIQKNPQLFVRDGHCLLWQGSCFDNRPQYWDSDLKRNFRLHKLVWQQIHGFVPAGHFAHSKCGDPRCLSVAHLHLITTRERNIQAHQNRRTPWKLKISKTRAVLPADVVRSIMHDDRSTSEIALEKGTNRDTVRKIKNGTAYRHITNFFVNL